jgi:hypothetical protein
MPPPHRAGALADHPLAPAFAETVQRIHHRYAEDVVLGFGLCPFLKDVESGFGEFHVVLEQELNQERLVGIAKASGTSVCHVIYPLVTGASPPFERFAALALGVIRKGDPRAPVMAVFHPSMSGDPSAAHRLVGLLRHSPDPFVQFVPKGLHEGGTVLASGGLNHNFGEARAPEVDNAAQQLRAASWGRRSSACMAGLAEIRARARSRSTRRSSRRWACRRSA